MQHYDIPSYLEFLPAPLLEQLNAQAEPVPEVPGLRIATGLRTLYPELETPSMLSFVCEVYQKTRAHLNRVLEQRRIDRDFMDARTKACREANRGVAYLSPQYQTVIGSRDATGRVVVGPLPARSELTAGPEAQAASHTRVQVPDFLKGDQVTLFGPPDTQRMSINAMNALHRRLPDEPSIVAELVERSGQVPRWGADDEDSKTPIMTTFLQATENLMGCFDGSLQFEDPRTHRVYRIEEKGTSLPIKRIPGLALPDGHHLLDGNPLPLHLFDFLMHFFHNWHRPQALVFYIPKLENEEEAAYLKGMIETAEEAILFRYPTYLKGSIRLFIVFENPRAIFRIRAIADALSPYFLGGSLGWHDYLASTARLLKEDPHYQIPVKADPNIVIHHIKESHRILVRALDPIGGIKIGGMYGVLYEEGNSKSFVVSIVGYIKDVVTQLKRGLNGFWVAHPNFVRLGIALVQAYRQHESNPQDGALDALISALVPDPVELEPLLQFVHGPDVPGLSEQDPLFLRGVLVADIETSEVIANSDPEEVRYNIFQALQYLADWLGGNGCVALPAMMRNASGEKVFVRIMDDLATTERSRWELWAEIRHGRVSASTFEQILKEELEFLRQDQETPTRRIQVRWQGEAARWYPIAARVLRQLVLDPEPVEFVTGLLLPFTHPLVREAMDPWQVVTTLCPGHYWDIQPS